MEKEKNSEEYLLQTKRHSLSHVMAAAIKELYPEAKFAIGPAVDNGFYYDIDFGETKVTTDDFKQIEKKMAYLIKQNLKFEQRDEDINEALKKAHDNGEVYKEELISDLKSEGQETVSVYKLGNFEDLCRGPHVDNTNKIKPGSFKLHKLAGAYWRGDENNKMLTRIYGLAFENKEELTSHLNLIKEAAKRDHRKLGKELDLFCFSDLVGPGLPMFTPKGVTIIDELRKHIEDVCRGYGFEKVITPHLAKIDLYEISGHAKKFNDELFRVTSIKGHEFVMKPVQCPHQTQIYASKQRSYKDLPIRYMESEKQYRAEKTGEVGGLSRVYAITVEDGHSFCTVDQVKQEIVNMVKIIKEFYSALGLWGNHWVSLSVRDYSHPEKYIGEEKDWDTCERMLEEISEEMDLNAIRQEGEAALYGPKLDFMFKDSLGKEIQIPTVQVDFATPKRFKLVYTDQNGEEQAPVMVHRAILGSYERFLSLLIEHFAGAFPVWLSPIQVKLISVSENHKDACYNISKKFKQENIRVEIDDSNETVGNKIRKATSQKIPYLLVIGDKEADGEMLSVRERGSADTKEISTTDFISRVKKEIEDKKV